MLEGNCLHVFLYASGNLPLVTPCIDVLQVRRNRGEEIIDLLLAGFVLLGDFVRDGSLKLANTAENIPSIRELEVDLGPCTAVERRS